ncbi:MAG TPA: phosphoglycerate mutase family protein [Abditibacteriaceae bacterium]|nr:phosphoglycerate mutase family protein [Abditibacteriaceae bacterium]
MQLLFMRHGLAAAMDESLSHDAVRPLTDEGIVRTREAGAALRACGVKLDLVVASPLLRAVQTAEIVREAYTRPVKGSRKQSSPPRLETWPELERADFDALQPRFHELSPLETALLIGHGREVSRLIARLLTGSPRGLSIDLRKAGICALDISPQVSFETDIEAEVSSLVTLLWHVGPPQLRLMGR